MFDVEVLLIDVYRELRMVEFLIVAPVQQQLLLCMNVTVANDAYVLLLMEVVLIS